MSGAIQITPGYLLRDGESLTEAILRLIATPTAQIPEKQITEREIDMASLQAALGNNIRPNLLLNGNFTEERWMDTEQSAPTGTDTVLAEGWFVNPTGAAISYGQGTSGPDVYSVMSALLTGATGATAVDFGQNLPRSASGLLVQKLTFSAWIHNNTGASFAPQLVLSTANVVNDFSAVTQQQATNLQTCPNEAWTEVSLTFDPGSFAGMNAGLRLALRFPSGTLNAGGKTIAIARVKLEVGEAATPMPWDNGPDLALFTSLLAQITPKLTPVGSIMAFAGPTAPLGWQLCAGQAISRTTYAGLFAVIATIYGGGDGSTTFNLPDWRGRVGAGKDDMGGTAANRLTAGSGMAGTALGAVGGDERLAAHHHPNTKAALNWGPNTSYSGGEHLMVGSYGLTFGDSGDAGAGGSQNVQPTIICNYIIFTGVA